MTVKSLARKRLEKAISNKRYYEKHREKRKQDAKERRKKLTAWWAEYKATLCCWYCGETRPECIDLHHVISSGKTSSRDSAASWVASSTRAIASVLREVTETCVPLCANCHREVHAMHRRMLRERQQTPESDIVDGTVR